MLDEWRLQFLLPYDSFPGILMVRRILGWYINLAIKDSEMFMVDL